MHALEERKKECVGTSATYHHFPHSSPSLCSAGSIASSSSPSMEGILSSSRSPILRHHPAGLAAVGGTRNLTPPVAGPRSAAEAAADHEQLKLPQSGGGGGSSSRNLNRPKTNFRDWICIRKQQPDPPQQQQRAQQSPSCCCGCCPTCCRAISRAQPQLWQPEGHRLQSLQQPQQQQQQQQHPQKRSQSPPYSKRGRSGSSSSSGGGGGRRTSRPGPTFPAATAAATVTADVELAETSPESLSPHSSSRN